MEGGVTTRSQAQGKPLKKPGAYDTDKYYQEKDMGFGDVGVDQEPDAGTMDQPGDEEYVVSQEDLKAADEAAMREDAQLPEANEPEDKEEIQETLADAKRTAGTGEEETDERGEPVPIEETTAEDQEAADAGQVMTS